MTSWCITSARIIGHQQALAGDLLLLLHLDDVMNLGIIKHIEAVKHWNALTISTAYHIPVFIEEHSNWSDTSWCHQPLWSPPSNYPCHPQCRQPSTHMFRLSHLLKVKKLMSTTITAAFQIQVEENSNRSDTSGRMSAISLVFSSKLSLPSMVSSSTNSHVLNMVRHVESINNSHVNQHSHSISHPS